jgi:hypothetical protein
MQEATFRPGAAPVRCKGTGTRVLSLVSMPYFSRPGDRASYWHTAC